MIRVAQAYRRFYLYRPERGKDDVQGKLDESAQTILRAPLFIGSKDQSAGQRLRKQVAA